MWWDLYHWKDLVKWHQMHIWSWPIDFFHCWEPVLMRNTICLILMWIQGRLWWVRYHLEALEKRFKMGIYSRPSDFFSWWCTRSCFKVWIFTLKPCTGPTVERGQMRPTPLESPWKTLQDRYISKAKWTTKPQSKTSICNSRYGQSDPDWVPQWVQILFPTDIFSPCIATGVSSKCGVPPMTVSVLNMQVLQQSSQNWVPWVAEAWSNDGLRVIHFREGQALDPRHSIPSQPCDTTS